jgi:hypothetical protein
MAFAHLVTIKRRVNSVDYEIKISGNNRCFKARAYRNGEVYGFIIDCDLSFLMDACLNGQPEVGFYEPLADAVVSLIKDGSWEKLLAHRKKQ